MKTKRIFVTGIILGALIGWALGFLRLPYLEKNVSFLLGFVTCFAFISLALVVSFIWNKNALLLRMIEKNSATREPKNAGWLYLLIWSLVSVFIVTGAIASSVLIHRQNKWLTIQAQKQDKRIYEMSELIQSSRKSSQAFLMNSLLNDIQDELADNPHGTLSDSLIARIAGLTKSLFKPYRYFDGDSLSDKELSPERGQLLLELYLMDIDSISFARIKSSVPFSGADLRGASLKGADLSRVDLRNACFKDADLRDANFSEADLRNAIFWGANLNNASLNSTDLRRANLSWAELNGADLKLANLDGANLTNAQFRNAELSGATLRWGKSDGTLFNEANLIEAILLGTSLTKVNFGNADLTKADLRRIDLSEANLAGAELNRAVVNENWLEKTKEWRLSGANEIQESYQVVNDSIDKGKKPVHRLKRITD